APGRGALRARRDDPPRTEGSRRLDTRDPAPLRSAHDPVRAARSAGGRRRARRAADRRAGRAGRAGLLDPVDRRRVARRRDASGRGADSARENRARPASARGHLHRHRVRVRKRVRGRRSPPPGGDRRGAGGRVSKVLQVAWREFIVTVTSKAFILGLLAVPVMSIVMVWAAPKVFGPGDLKAQGAVAVIDPDGRVNDALRTALDPDSVRRRREQVAARALEQLPPEARALVGGQAIAQAGPGIELVLDERPADADIEAEKARLHAAPPAERPLALVVLHENVVEPRDGSPALGGYDLYVPPRLDDRIQGEIRRALTDAIVMARITARGYDP